MGYLLSPFIVQLENFHKSQVMKRFENIIDNVDGVVCALAGY